MSATSGGGSTSSSTPTTQTPDLVTSAAPWGAYRALGGTQPQRNFAQIISEEKANRNIIEITLKKIITKNEDGTEAKPVNLTFDDIGEFIFDILKINPDDCLAFDYNTGRYDTRQIKFKPGTNTDSFVRAQSINLKSI